MLVPTVPVGMPSSTLRVFGAGAGTRESPRRRFHAARGDEMNSWRRLAWRQWRGVVERVVPEILFLFLLLLFLLLLVRRKGVEEAGVRRRQVCAGPARDVGKVVTLYATYLYTVTCW